MKNNIFKNFLRAASISVISLLTTISPSSVKAMEDIHKESGKKAPLDFLQDWVGLGLVKTNAMEVKEGDKLTVTLTFDEVTEPTALSFLNSEQNGYYDGGVVVQPGTKKVTLTSIVPKGETQTWLIIRNPGFNGVSHLPLGLKLNQASLTVEKAAPLDMAKAAPLDFLQDWVGLGLVKTKPMDVREGDKLNIALTFDEVTAPTALSFLNSAQNGYYEGGVVVQPGTKSIRFSSIVPRGETQTWVIIRNPGFNGVTPLPLGLKLNQVLLNVAKAAPLDFLQDWIGLGLVKTNPMDVKEGDKLSVTCTFDEVTAPTALSFLNSAQNGYYEGGIIVQPGTKKVTLTSIVPRGDTQTWLVLRDPAFNGVTQLHLAGRLNQALLTVEKAAPLDLLQDWTKTKLVRNFSETPKNEWSVESPAYDLGYAGRSRSRQYGAELGFSSMNLPTAPVFHPYDPTDALLEGYYAPSFSLNVKLPKGYNNLAFAPLALNRLLEQKDPNSIEYFLIVQDVPWDLDKTLLEYRPQTWLDTEAPSQQNENYWKAFPSVRVGVFSREGQEAPIIEEQNPGNLLQANDQVVVHNGRGGIPDIPGIETDEKVLDFRQRAENGETLKAEEKQNDRGFLDAFLLTLAQKGRFGELTKNEQRRVGALGWKQEDPTRFGYEPVVSSGDCFKLLNFKMDASQVLWSLTEDVTSGKIAVVKHVFLTPEHNALFEEVLKRPNVKTYEDIQNELGIEKIGGNRFPLKGGSTLADELDIPRG